MAINQDYVTIKSDSIVKVLTAQVVVKATLDANADGFSVLGTSAEANAIAIEPMQGEVVISGKVNFKALLYNNEEGVMSLDYFADFSENIKSELISASSKLIADLKVIDTSSVTEGNDIMLTAVVEMVIEETLTYELSALANIGDSIFAKNNTINSDYMVACAQGAFEVYDEIQTAGVIDKILNCDIKVATLSTECFENVVVINVEAYVSVCYKAEGKLVTTNLIIPFKEELEASGATAGCSAISNLYIKSKRIILSANKGDNLVRIELVVAARIPVFKSEKYNIVCDVFSCKNTLECDMKKTECLNYIKYCCFKQKISASAALDDKMPKVAEIMAVSLAKNNVANLIAGNNQITIEGLVTCCVVYMSVDGVPASVRAELPYSLKLPAEGVCMGDILSGYGVVYNVYAYNNKGSIDLKADICVCSKVQRKNSFIIITNVVEGDLKCDCSNAISMYVANGGEELWDIVKIMSLAPEMIAMQNPDMGLPLVSGNKVIVYREL